MGVEGSYRAYRKAKASQERMRRMIVSRDHEEALVMNEMIDEYRASLRMEFKADFYGYSDHDMEWHTAQARGHMSGAEDRPWLQDQQESREQ